MFLSRALRKGLTWGRRVRNSAGAWPSSAEPNSDRHPNSKTSQQWDTPVDSDIGGAWSICAACPPHTSCSSAYPLSHIHKLRSGTVATCTPSSAFQEAARRLDLEDRTHVPTSRPAWEGRGQDYLPGVYPSGPADVRWHGRPHTSPSGLGEEDPAQNLQSLTVFHYESQGFCSFPGESRSGESADAWLCPLPSHQQSCLSSDWWLGPCRKATWGSMVSSAGWGQGWKEKASKSRHRAHSALRCGAGFSSFAWPHFSSLSLWENRDNNGVSCSCLVTQPCLSLCDPMDRGAWKDSPGKNTGVGCHFFLQIIVFRWI